MTDDFIIEFESLIEFCHGETPPDWKPDTRCEYDIAESTRLSELLKSVTKISEQHDRMYDEFLDIADHLRREVPKWTIHPDAHTVLEELQQSIDEFINSLEQP